jgi:uncharacterized NAD-dependent epimerase/dehydratase family protein
MTPIELADHIAAQVAAAAAGYGFADALYLAAIAEATTDFAVAAYATADADLVFIEAQYAMADACWRLRS